MHGFHGELIVDEQRSSAHAFAHASLKAFHEDTIFTTKQDEFLHGDVWWKTGLRWRVLFITFHEYAFLSQQVFRHQPQIFLNLLSLFSRENSLSLRAASCSIIIDRWRCRWLWWGCDDGFEREFSSQFTDELEKNIFLQDLNNKLSERGKTCWHGTVLARLDPNNKKILLESIFACKM